MPHCPICKYEYETGICRCPDCDVDLVDRLEEAIVPEPTRSDDGLECAILAERPMESAALKGMLGRLAESVFSSPAMIVIVGIIFNLVMQPVLFGILTMFGIHFRPGAMSLQITGIISLLIPPFIMGFAMGKFASYRSARAAFAIGLALAFTMSMLGALIIALIPHRGAEVVGSWTLLGVISAVIWLIVQAAIFLAGFLLARRRGTVG